MLIKVLVLIGNLLIWLFCLGVGGGIALKIMEKLNIEGLYKLRTFVLIGATIGLAELLMTIFTKLDLYTLW